MAVIRSNLNATCMRSQTPKPPDSYNTNHKAMNLINLFTIVAPLLPAHGMAINTPSPMLVPQFPNCEQFGQAVDGDNCDTMAGRGQISRDEFFRLNPGLNGEAGCQSGNIVPGHWYCFKELTPLDGKMGHPRPTRPEAPKTTQPAPETTQPPREKTHPPPETTQPPLEPQTCAWGSCWKSWVKLSTASEDYIVESASRSCSRLFTQPCHFDIIDFPEDIKEGCDSCEMLSSGCPCFTKSLYHTYTIGLEYSELHY